MKKFTPRKKKDKKLLDLFEQYQVFKRAAQLVQKKELPPLTLDQQIESINPYYVRNEVIKYG